MAMTIISSIRVKPRCMSLMIVLCAEVAGECELVADMFSAAPARPG